MALIISIDGNIGSGKSTLIDNLKKHFLNEDVIFLEEPINEWNKIKDENNKTILEKYYENINKYAFCFQMMTFITRYVLLLETIKQNPKANQQADQTRKPKGNKAGSPRKPNMETTEPPQHHHSTTPAPPQHHAGPAPATAGEPHPGLPQAVPGARGRCHHRRSDQPEVPPRLD